MSIITFKINDKFKIEWTYNDSDNSFSLKLLFRFNKHNSNWLYFILDSKNFYKLIDVINDCLNSINNEFCNFTLK